MKIGIISDTHNNLKNVAAIVELFNNYGVERVIHTGDVTQAKTLNVLANLNAPLFGVFGNNDHPERDTLDVAIAEHGFTFMEPPFEFTWHGRSIILVHDPLEFDGHLKDSHDLALHGHTHRYRLEHEAGLMFFNPGECAGHMAGMNAIGVVDLEDLSIEILKF